MPSRLSWFLQSSAALTFTATTGFFVWTKHCQFEPMDPSTDPTFQSLSYKRFNPNNNPPFYDVCVRRFPLRLLDPELVKDAEAGGNKLVERFAQGVWGGFGFAIQREYMKYKYRNNTTTAHQLWTKDQLKTSDYKTGTELTDHFQVLEHPNNHTILFRCGDSPLHNPDSARPGDGLFEMSAEAKLDEGFAELRLKSVFYQGEGKASKAPFEGEWFFPWAHRQYAKLWMEGALAHCKERHEIDWENVKPHLPRKEVGEKAK